MAFDRTLADRLTSLLPPEGGFVVKRMFGGIAILLNGNMCVGVLKTDLILRIGPEPAAEALNSSAAREFDITGRPMKGWVMVEGDDLSDDELFAWTEKAVRFVSTLRGK